MKIKKYVAKSMPEAMNEIRKELGSEAVILNSKQIKTGGFLGLFQTKSIEVIAALDKEPVVTKKQYEQEVKQTVHSANRGGTENKEVLTEIKQLKQLLATQSFQSVNDFPPLFEKMHTYLLNQEVDKPIAKEIITSVIERANELSTVSDERIKQLTKNEIVNRMDHVSFNGITEGKQIIQFVGPTGVGKTTTLAKVAASNMLDEKKNIAFITTDTYRIAAIEQLKTYATILGVPVEVAYSMEDYKDALKKFAHYDLIFVDTAGRNFRDEKYVDELKNMIDFETYKVETYLVQSLTAKAQDVIDIYEKFAAIPVEKVIFTKLDETLSYGSILNISRTKAIDIAYFTNGQDVPDDLLEPSAQMVSDLILSRYNDE